MADELTSEQEADLLERLRALKDDLRAQVSRGADETKPVDLDLPIGRLSRIDAIQQQQMAKAGRQSLEIRLRQVEAALRAARDGEFGLCRGCGEPIGWARLAARPESPRCLDCQDRAESGS